MGIDSGLAPPPPSRWLLLLLAFTAGATVANVYYCQPLLSVIASSFGVGPGGAGAVATATQLGYAAGLLLIVPLGDRFERKRLIASATGLSSLALAAVAVSPGILMMVAASFLTGAISVTPQMVVPYTAGLVAPGQRGRAVGAVMSGLLVGILFSRTVSGFLGAHAGWRTVYWMGAAAMLVLAALLAWVLPVQRPASGSPAGYGQLIGSLWPLWKREPLLRRHSVLGALGFGAFSAFWTTLTFHLGGLPQHFGSEAVGLFGLLGAAGALAAPVAGHLADRTRAGVLNGGALAVVALSFALMGLWGGSMVALSIGVVLMDAGVQASHISNQTRIYSLASELRNRLNAVYMVAYFIGGALGSAIGSWAWAHAGWAGVCWAGGIFGAAGAAAILLAGDLLPERAAAAGEPS